MSIDFEDLELLLADLASATAELPRAVRDRLMARVLDADHVAPKLSTACILGMKSRRHGARPPSTPDSWTISETYCSCR